MKSQLAKMFSGGRTKEQAKDTGMALVLVLLLLALATRQPLYLQAAVAVQLLNMVAPQLFRPAAVVWLGLSHLLGNVVSRAVLAVVFLVVVTPIGLLRRAFGADAMRLKSFKASRATVMQERNHTFVASDIEQPF